MQEIKGDLGKLFKQAVTAGLKVQTDTRTRSFIIYKGFKLSKVVDVYSILDTRFNDFYSEVRDSDLQTLLTLGLERGADTIMYKRDTERIQTYKNRIANLYKRMQEVYEPKLNEGVKIEFFNKRVRNAYDNIDYFADLIGLCRHKNSMFENKWS